MEHPGFRKHDFENTIFQIRFQIVFEKRFLKNDFEISRCSSGFLRRTISRGLIPLHQPLQQRFPVQDLSLDLVRCGRAVNRWIPIPALEFLMYDVDRVLRGGGFLWIDHFLCQKSDLDCRLAYSLSFLSLQLAECSSR